MGFLNWREILILTVLVFAVIKFLMWRKKLIDSIACPNCGAKYMWGQEQEPLLQQWCPACNKYWTQN